MLRFVDIRGFRFNPGLSEFSFQYVHPLSQETKLYTYHMSRVNDLRHVISNTLYELKTLVDSGEIDKIKELAAYPKLEDLAKQTPISTNKHMSQLDGQTPPPSEVMTSSKKDQ